MGFDRPLAYSQLLQGVGWVMEMFLQWIVGPVVSSLWWVGVKMFSVGNPLKWLRSGAFRGSGWICKHFLFTSLWNPENKGKLYFEVWFSYFLALFFLHLIPPPLSLPLSVSQTTRNAVYCVSKFSFKSFSRWHFLLLFLQILIFY